MPVNAYSSEYQKMYDALKESNWKIDINNIQYKVEKLKDFSYINYEDYSYWSKLIDKIVLI